jgi:hypothetical protein
VRLDERWTADPGRPDFPEAGCVFKDITPLLADHDAFSAVVERSAEPAATPTATVVDKVVGMEARGFILAAPVALALGAGFVPVRKAGKLPGRRTRCPTRWSTARRRSRVHADAHPTRGAGAARRRRAGHRRHRRATRPARRALRRQRSPPSPCCMELRSCTARDAVGDVPLTPAHASDALRART